VTALLSQHSARRSSRLASECNDAAHDFVCVSLRAHAGSLRLDHHACGGRRSPRDGAAVQPTHCRGGERGLRGRAGHPGAWQIPLGTWQADGQTYNSTVATNAVTTLFQYQTFDFGGPDTADYLRWNEFTLPGHIAASNDYRYKGRLLNQYGASGNLVGLVFSYDSAEDYLEAVFSPTGQRI
jgi:hypothetical protein